MGEAIQSQLQAVGIRSRLRTMERAAYFTAWREKKLHGIILVITAAMGNAATRIEPYATRNGIYAYGSLPEVDDLYHRQARELDPKKREGMYHEIQRKLMRDVPMVPLMMRPESMVHSPKLQGMPTLEPIWGLDVTRLTFN